MFLLLFIFIYFHLFLFIFIFRDLFAERLGIGSNWVLSRQVGRDLDAINWWFAVVCFDGGGFTPHSETR